jgi:hypothetical protein
MVKPYFYVRFVWRENINLKNLFHKLSREFKVEDRPMPYGDMDVSLYKMHRDSLKVNADTLSAFLYPFKAVLFQKAAAPFTSRDLSLRNKILELYPRNRSTLVTISFTREPKYDIA